MKRARVAAWARASVVAGATLVGAGVSASAAGAAERLVTVESRSTPIDVHDGTAIWSSYDSGRYRLKVLHRGSLRTLPVRSQLLPFDADLGPGGAGDTVVVYSRCREEAVEQATARGCDLYRYRLKTQRESRVKGTSRPGYSEVMPSQWRARVAFARYRDPTNAEVPALHRLRLHQSGRRHLRIQGGTPVGPGGEDPDGRVSGLELVGTRVAFGWGFGGPRCRILTEDKLDVTGTEIWTARIGHRSSLIANGCSGDRTVVRDVSLAPGRLSFLRLADADAPSLTTVPLERPQSRSSRPLAAEIESVSSDAQTSASVSRTSQGYLIAVGDGLE